MGRRSKRIDPARAEVKEKVLVSEQSLRYTTPTQYQVSFGHQHVEKRNCDRKSQLKRKIVFRYRFRISSLLQTTIFSAISSFQYTPKQKLVFTLEWYIYIYTHTHTHTHTHIWFYLRTMPYIYMYIYIYIYIWHKSQSLLYIYIYTHTYIYSA